MDLGDEERAVQPSAIVPGEDLSAHSVEELQDRIARLKAEIERCEGVIASKRASREDAESVFGRPS